jgi:hypothetical protein
MIRETEVKYLISNEIPALAVDLALVNHKNDLYQSIECLTHYTKSLIREHRVSEVGQCFETAYELLHDGTSLVRLAVVSIYINSVSRLLECSFCPEQSVKSEFLKNFGEEYHQLIYARNP